MILSSSLMLRIVAFIVVLVIVWVFIFVLISCMLIVVLLWNLSCIKHICVVFIIILVFFLLFSETLIKSGCMLTWVCILIGCTTSITPVVGALSGVHLWEQETEDSFSVFPIEVYKFNCDLLLSSIWQLFWWSQTHVHAVHIFVMSCKFFSPLLLKLSSLLLLYLLQCFKEELFDIRPLV